MHYFCSTWEYKAILVYIFMGSFFITYQNAGLSYGELVTSSFTHKIFLVVILYPSFIAMFMNLYQYINKNYCLLLRIRDRKKYAQFCIHTVVGLSLFLFLHVVVIVLINCNITPHADFKFTHNLGYDSPDFIVFLVAIMKVLLTVLGIGLFNLFLQFTIKRRKIVGVILMFSLTLLFFGDKFYPCGIFVMDLFNPGFQSHGYMLINHIWELIVSGLIYFPIVFLLLYFGILKSSKKIYIGVE